MRTDQRRYFGHPDLVMFIQRLSRQGEQSGYGYGADWRYGGCLLVVVSTAVTPATRLDWMSISSCNCQKTRWTSAQLLRPQALDLVSRDGKHVVPTLWKPEIFSLIKLAAQDKDVTRIFC